jgi:hypothetical protein
VNYLSRHRPICSVLMEIRTIAHDIGDERIVKLCDEATEYAQSMSKKLAEYKANAK